MARLAKRRFRCFSRKHPTGASFTSLCFGATALNPFTFVVKVTDGLSELKDVDRASVYDAGKDLAGAAVNVLARGLTLPYHEVGAAGPFLPAIRFRRLQ